MLKSILWSCQHVARLKHAELPLVEAPAQISVAFSGPILEIHDLTKNITLKTFSTVGVMAPR
jgi:hypothetical protein